MIVRVSIVLTRETFNLKRKLRSKGGNLSSMSEIPEAPSQISGLNTAPDLHRSCRSR